MGTRITSDKEGRSILSDLDERLESIDNQVKILLERQRLSRFDNLMFLVYPLVILGISLSFTTSLQYEVMKGILLWGIPLANLLALSRVVLLGGFGLAFIIFLLAYAYDNLDDRIRSCVFLIQVISIMTLGLLVVLLVQLLLKVSGLFATDAAQFLIVWPFFIALAVLVLEGAGRLQGFLHSWLSRSMRVSLEERIVLLSPTRKPLKARMLAKASWSVSSTTYFVVLLIALWRGQLNNDIYEAAYAFYATAFFIVTEAIILWRL